MLARIDAADVIDDLNTPSFRLDQLKGELKGYWSVTVRTNWRIIFRSVNGKAEDVELIDCH